MMTNTIPSRDVARQPPDELPFRDQSRFNSPEITRAFASIIGAGSPRSECHAADPDAVALDSDVEGSDIQIVRGVD